MDSLDLSGIFYLLRCHRWPQRRAGRVCSDLRGGAEIEFSTPGGPCGGRQAANRQSSAVHSALLVALATFDGPSLNDLKEDRLLYLVAITDVLRTMVVERFEAVRAIRLEIRNMDRRRVLAPLVAGAGSGYRSLRINATVILASVVDNGTVCLVLQQLRNGARNAPEKINLVQVVSSMAGYAFRETVEATAQMVQKVRGEQSGFSPEDWRRIAVHLDEVEQGMSASINKDHSLPPTEAFCKDFDYEG